MDEAKLRTLAQLQEFLNATQEVKFTGAPGESDQQRYERLSRLSVSHLYNLRNSADYQAQRTHFTKTRAVCNPIGVRKAPRPNGRAGWVRIDSVHQGDLGGIKMVYHITCVDAVSPWQVQACMQGISEAFLLPVLEMVIDQFPFQIEGFHSDNGSPPCNTPNRFIYLETFERLFRPG